ncbi:MAG: SMC-Scp complex subunit ScpB [Vicinamibacterales bacterium]
MADTPDPPVTTDAVPEGDVSSPGHESDGPATSGVSAHGAPDAAGAEAPDVAGAADAAPGPGLDAILGEAAAPAVSAELKAIVEALVFASPEPLTTRVLFRLLADEPKDDVRAALEALKQEYDSRPGLQMVEVAGGYQIVTRPDLHEWVRRLFHEHSTQKLTVQGLETLAIIAYRQPVTALEVTEIRGVNASGVLTTLLERHLIKIVGRKNVVGRPFLYATTREFLIRFGLNDLSDLPRVEDMIEALGFDPPAGLIERTPAEDVLPLDEPESEPDEPPAPEGA